MRVKPVARELTPAPTSGLSSTALQPAFAQPSTARVGLSVRDRVRLASAASAVALVLFVRAYASQVVVLININITVRGDFLLVVVEQAVVH